jgi:hypothetical protein
MQISASRCAVQVAMGFLAENAPIAAMGTAFLDLV